MRGAEIIPDSSVEILPFTPQPISQWAEDSDLLEYLYALYDMSCVMTDSEGRGHETTYREYGKYLFDNGKQKYQSIADEFGEKAAKAQPAPAADRQVERIPDFRNDERFGLMAKYAIAWDGALSATLSEDAFFSMVHVLESGSDLDCSVLLASNLYYRQALQVLRNYLEEVFMQLYLCKNEALFSSWVAGNFRTPSFRGRRGILRELVSEGILLEGMVDNASDLCEVLNASIHGAESYLIHRGTFEGEWTGLLFKYDRFQQWCDFLSRCVDLGIRVLRLTVNDWLDTRSPTGIQCSVCHSTNNFDVVERHQFGTKSSVTLRCRQCGNEVSYNADYASTWGFD